MTSDERENGRVHGNELSATGLLGRGDGSLGEIRRFFGAGACADLFAGPARNISSPWMEFGGFDVGPAAWPTKAPTPCQASKTARSNPIMRYMDGWRGRETSLSLCCAVHSPIHRLQWLLMTMSIPSTEGRGSRGSFKSWGDGASSPWILCLWQY